MFFARSLTLFHLLCQCSVSSARRALLTITKYALRFSKAFTDSGAARNDCLINARVRTIACVNGFDHIPCHIGTMVCHGNQDTVNLQFRIDFPANFTDGANDTGKTFDIKNQRLYRNQYSVCGCKRGGDKVAEFRHTVNQAIVVLPLKWFQCPLHYAFAHKGICQTSL